MHIGRALPPAASPIGLSEVISGVCGIFRGQKELERFRSELKEHFGVKHCFLVSSGKAGFALTLLALKELFPGRDEVVIPAFTCYSVPSSVIRAELRIRLCDLQPDSLDFDYAQLSTLLSEASAARQADAFPVRGVTGSRVKACDAINGSRDSINRLLAIVPTHLFGFPSDVSRLRKLVQDPGVTIVEDAAQAMGETWEGRKLGTLGDVSFFSLGRGKAFSAVEGGIILTDRDDIADVLDRRAGRLPHYGLWQLMTLVLKAVGLMFFTHPLFFWVPRSMPFLGLGQTLIEPHFPILKMSSFQAGLTAKWRERLQKLQDTRKKNVNRWTAILEANGNGGLCFQHRQSLGLLRFPVRVRDIEKRQSLLRESAQKGMGIMPVYPDSINRVPELRGEIPARAFPVAEGCARELVTLPTHNYVTNEDMTVVGELLSRTLA